MGNNGARHCPCRADIASMAATSCLLPLLRTIELDHTMLVALGMRILQLVHR